MTRAALSPQEAALACARVLLEQLRSAGMERVVVSPGSRSAPLAVAASRLGMVEKVVLDERSAAFFALGLALSSGRLVGTICTSGTAVAEQLPGIVEASRQRVPLVMLTADRPEDLHGVGANQTISQSGLFGSFAKIVIELPVASQEALGAWQLGGVSAAGTALEGPKGPVQVNVPFAEPFGPGEGMPKVPAPKKVEHALELPTSASAEVFAELGIASGVSGVISIGPGTAPHLVAEALSLAADCGWPIVSSRLVSISGVPESVTQVGAAALEGVLPAAPEVIIHVGGSPTTRAALRFQELAEVMVTVDQDLLIADPSRASRSPGKGLTVRDLAGVTLPACDQEWVRKLGNAEAVVQDVLANRREFDEMSIVRAIAASVGKDAIFVGNSTPARAFEFAVPPGERAVFSNRGASGIDGLAATISGIAATRNVTGIIGDLSALHDLGSIAWMARDTPARLVVIDNDGGGIFGMLASRDLPEHEELFATPHGLSLAKVFASLGARVTEVENLDSLQGALVDPISSPMHIVLARVTREQNRDNHVAFVEAIRETIRERG